MTMIENEVERRVRNRVAEAQKPLVELLRATRSQLRGRNNLDPLLPIIDAALAKIGGK